MERRQATIYDVAQRAKVSKSLVSLVLRGSDRVSEPKRQAVLEAVAALDYTPSRLAAGLAGSTRSIGVAIDDFSNLWFTEALVGLRDAFAHTQYTLSVADLQLNAHVDQDPLEVFTAQRVDGVILAGETSARSAANLRVPAVVLGFRASVPESVPVIGCDEVYGGALAAEHLLRLGRKRFVCVSANIPVARARQRGFVHRLRDEGAQCVVIDAEATDEHSAHRAVAKWLSAHQGEHGLPDAVFAVNDPMALGAMGQFEANGLRVPADVSVVGYDNTPLADYAHISLTSVDCGFREQGARAGKELLQRIDLQRIEQHAHHTAHSLVRPQLVVRSSSGVKQ
jgi:DNA-binding LacI/PurR family transcriptional regulator